MTARVKRKEVGHEAVKSGEVHVRDWGGEAFENI